MKIPRRSLKFCSSFKRDLFSDALLILNQTAIPIHRMVLTRNSTFFQNISWDQLPKDHLGRPILQINHPHPSYVETILAYLYGCRINYTPIQAVGLYVVARDFGLPDIWIFHPRPTDRETSITVFNLIHQLGLVDLEPKVNLPFFSKEDIPRLHSGNLVARIVQWGRLNVQDEFELIHILEEWRAAIKNDDEVNKVIPWIRLASMRVLYPDRFLNLSTSLFDFESFQDIYREASNWSLSWKDKLPNKRDELRSSTIFSLLNSGTDYMTRIIIPTIDPDSDYGYTYLQHLAEQDPCTHGFRLSSYMEARRATFAPGACPENIGMGSLITISPKNVQFSQGDVMQIMKVEQILAIRTSSDIWLYYFPS